MADYRSTYLNNYELDEAESRVRRSLGMDKDYELPDEVNSCIAEYKYQQRTLTLDTIWETQDALRLTNSVIKLLKAKVKEGLEYAEMKMNEPHETSGGKKDDNTSFLLNQLDEIFKFSKELPDKINSLDKLEKQHTIELSSKSKGRKGGKNINYLEQKKNVDDIVNGHNGGVSVRKID